MKPIKQFSLAALAVVVAGLLGWSFAPQPAAVQLAPVTRGAFRQVVEEDGKTRVRERYLVSAPLAGTVGRIAFKAGDAVARDQVLALITPNAPALLDARALRELGERVGAAEAAVLRADAETARAQAALDKAGADLARNRKLAAGGFVSPTQADQSELEFKLSQRALESAQQAAHAAGHDLATARAALLQSRGGGRAGRPWEVRAPVAGRVLKVLQESEGAVGLGAALLEIGDPMDTEIVADVLSTDAVLIRPGAPVQVVGWGKPEPLEARVRRVEPSAFTKVSALGVEEQRVNVVIDLIAPPAQWQGLSDGFKVDARIVVFSADDALKVPVGALFRKDSQWAVFVAAAGRAQERAVRIARRSGTEAMVEQGLQPGEQVVVYPGDAVRDGQRIRAQ